MISKRFYCQECGSYSENWHKLDCSHLTLERRAQLLDCYLKTANEAARRITIANKRLSEQVTFWKGKFSILKEENNALRRKLRKLEDRKSE